MKFISWNVNGLRACLKKGFEDVFRTLDADFFCIQETKMQPGQADFAPEGYTEYIYSADKKGYSGTAVWAKTPALSVRYGLDEDVHNHEGRAITLEYPDFYLVNLYVPNAQNELARIASRNQDIPELSVVLEIFHQFSQPLVPALFRFQFLEVEVQTFTLEVVHALAGCTQAAACTSHRVGDKNGHIGITAVNVVSVRQQPSGSVGLSVLYCIFFFPCVDVTVSFYQLGRVQDIAAYGFVIISFSGRIQ